MSSLFSDLSRLLLFSPIIPWQQLVRNFNRDTVYVSHIKILLKCYNLLQSLNLIKELVIIEEEKEQKEETKDTEVIEPKSIEKAKKGKPKMDKK